MSTLGENTLQPLVYRDLKGFRAENFLELPLVFHRIIVQVEHERLCFWKYKRIE